MCTCDYTSHKLNIYNPSSHHGGMVHNVPIVIGHPVHKSCRFCTTRWVVLKLGNSWRILIFWPSPCLTSGKKMSNHIRQCNKKNECQYTTKLYDYSSVVGWANLSVVKVPFSNP